MRVTSFFGLFFIYLIHQKKHLPHTFIWFYASLRLQSLQSTKQKGAADKGDKGNDNDGREDDNKEENVRKQQG